MNSLDNLNEVKTIDLEPINDLSVEPIFNEEESMMQLLTKDLLPKEDKKEIKLGKKEARLSKKFLNPIDIRFQGFLSYRHLRIIAWICIALSHFSNIDFFATTTLSMPIINPTLSMIFAMLGELATPFFLLAGFGSILSRSKPFHESILVYGAGFFSVSFGLLFAFYHYAFFVFDAIGMDVPSTSILLGGKFGKVLLINIFADLFFLTLFNFFINYTPKKRFLGKKLKLFRLLSLLPLAYIVTGDVLRVLSLLSQISLPIEVFPFLTSKSFIMHLVFIFISLWIKKREGTFLRIGASKRDYESYQLTNRNSLEFSKMVVYIFLVFAFVDYFICLIVYNAAFGGPIDNILEVFNLFEAIGINQFNNLIIACPVILLYSFTRKAKNKIIDVFVPVAGVGLVIIVTLEGGAAILRNLKDAELKSSDSISSSVANLIDKAIYFLRH